MGIGKGGSPTTTNNQQNQNVASYQQASNVPTGLPNFQDIYNRANAASQAAYQPYGGELVQGLNGSQQGAINNINEDSQGARSYYNTAGQMTAGVNPLTDQQIQRYYNPYQSNVVDALMQNINETNAQQNQQVKGNAISQHALGGDREAVAEAELARQQNLGNAPTIANTLQQGYAQALQTAGQQYQQIPLQVAQQYANIGGQKQASALQGAEAQYNVGTQQQQTGQAQDTAQYQQYLQQLAYPYQQAQFFANIGIPASGAMGGQQFQQGQQYQTGLSNQVTTPPGLSFGQGIAGAGLIAGGLGFGLGSGTGTAAEGGRVQHRYPGGRSVDHDNPYAVEPWNVKAVDITKGAIGSPLQTPTNQTQSLQPIRALPNITTSGQQQQQQSGSLGDIGQGISAAKGLYGLGKSAYGLIGGIGAADALAAGTDAGIALGGLGEGAAAATAGAGAAADFGLGDLLAAGLVFAKRGGSIYPKRFADGGWAAEEDIANKAAQSGPLAQMMQSRIMTGGKPVDRAAGGSNTEDDDSDEPWAQEGRWPAQGTPTAIPPWKSADPRGDAAALRNYGMTQSPEVSPSNAAYPMPQARPSPYTKPDDAELPDKSPPDSARVPTRVDVTKGTGFDPAAASYQDLMDQKNFKDYAPKRQSLMSLLKDPSTRGDAMLEMGLRILAAPPTSKSGLSEIATGALGTQEAYNKFSENATTAQQKAQELAVRLKGLSNTDEQAEAKMDLEKEKLKALTVNRDAVLAQRFQRIQHGNIVTKQGQIGRLVNGVVIDAEGEPVEDQTGWAKMGVEKSNPLAAVLGDGGQKDGSSAPRAVPDPGDGSRVKGKWYIGPSGKPQQWLG